MNGTLRTRERRSHRGKPVELVCGLIVALGAAGCGKKAVPLPPEPRAPLSAEALLVRQLGDRVIVGFTVPDSRGPKPGQQLAGAELLRVAYPPGPVPPRDPGVFDRRGEVVGRIEAEPLEPASRAWLVDESMDELPDGGRGWTLRYGVRLLDARGRQTPISSAGDLVPASSLPAPEDFVARATAEGIDLEWDAAAVPTPLGYNLYRSLAGEPFPDVPLNEEPLMVGRYLDATVVTGSTYVYQVRRVLGEGAPPRESAASETRELVAEDRFAPGAPRGLVAVQEGSAVRLFWDPNPEPDVAGYRIWRREAPADWQRVGPELIRDNTWLDTDVVSGVTLTYRVTALDSATPPNESAPSVEKDLVTVTEPAGEAATP